MKPRAMTAGVLILIVLVVVGLAPVASAHPMSGVSPALVCAWEPDAHVQNTSVSGYQLDVYLYGYDNTVDGSSCGRRYSEADLTVSPNLTGGTLNTWLEDGNGVLHGPYSMNFSASASTQVITVTSPVIATVCGIAEGQATLSTGVKVPSIILATSEVC